MKYKFDSWWNIVFSREHDEVKNGLDNEAPIFSFNYLEFLTKSFSRAAWDYQQQEIDALRKTLSLNNPNFDSHGFQMTENKPEKEDSSGRKIVERYVLSLRTDNSYKHVFTFTSKQAAMDWIKDYKNNFASESTDGLGDFKLEKIYRITDSEI